jgi:hypothetical protein
MSTTEQTSSLRFDFERTSTSRLFRMFVTSAGRSAFTSTNAQVDIPAVTPTTSQSLRSDRTLIVALLSMLEITAKHELYVPMEEDWPTGSDFNNAAVIVGIPCRKDFNRGIVENILDN